MNCFWGLRRVSAGRQTWLAPFQGGVIVLVTWELVAKKTSLSGGGVLPAK